jgi:transposase InsO family protein
MQYHPQTAVKTICGLFGKTRQAWYKQQWSSDKLALKEAIVIEQVRQVRQQMPRLGTRKLHYLISDGLKQHNIQIGRDKLFDILAVNGMLIRRRKRRGAVTTDARHPFHKYPNLAKELRPQRANELWVSDITYIRLKEDFCYLSLITDAYSRKIVGYCLYPTLGYQGPLQALQMALQSLPRHHGRLVHHSDRGLQYCCGAYVNLLEQNSMAISMTENGDPYENALAERMNGILKAEFGLDRTFQNYQQAGEVTATAVDIYNNSRPHSSCNYLTPQIAHEQQGPLKARWKKKEVAMVT